MTILAHIITEDSVVLIKDGKTESIPSSHPSYNEITEAVDAGDYVTAERLMDVSADVQQFVGDSITISNGIVYYGGQAVNGTIVDRILTIKSRGGKAEHLIAFLENLMANPSKSAVDELYDFLESSKLPITPDGHFLAYKKVKDDYTSFYDDTTTNYVGDLLSMPRNQVDDNRSNTCSDGYHFCSQGYLPCYWGGRGRVLIVKINPTDVVSIPNDYNFEKGRACRYQIVGEVDQSEVENIDNPNHFDENQNGIDERYGFEEDPFNAIRPQHDSLEFLTINEAADRFDVDRSDIIQALDDDLLIRFEAGGKTFVPITYNLQDIISNIGFDLDDLFDSSEYDTELNMISGLVDDVKDQLAEQDDAQEELKNIANDLGERTLRDLTDLYTEVSGHAQSLWKRKKDELIRKIIETAQSDKVQDTIRKIEDGIDSIRNRKNK